MNADVDYRILQLIPASGWWYEDRSAVARITERGHGYWYTHEPLIAWALVEATGRGSGETWTAIMGCIRSDEDQFVDTQACDPEWEIACEPEQRNDPLGCQHWQSLPVPVQAIAH